MTVYLHTIATALPPTVYPQPFVRDLLRAQPGLSRLAQRLIPSVFNASGIDTRYSVIADYDGADGGAGGPFFDAQTRTMLSPSTGLRNELYQQEAPALFIGAARQALTRSGLRPEQITHVVTVSCTGFFAPGPDYLVVRALGLPTTTQRFHVGFMGCYAAFPALRMAQAFCEADPSAAVLVICAELCTLHAQVSSDPETLVSSAVFADGAAAAVLSSQAPQAGSTALRLDDFATALTPPEEGEHDMAWTIGDQGYHMVLSSYVPQLIATHLHSAVGPLLTGLPGTLSEAGQHIERWAVHPGGRSILDKVEGSLGLSTAQMAPSREVLRQYGNMSSATVLFILGDLLSELEAADTDGVQDGERICALAFGPGLTVESALMTAVQG